MNILIKAGNQFEAIKQFFGLQNFLLYRLNLEKGGDFLGAGELQGIAQPHAAGFGKLSLFLSHWIQFHPVGEAEKFYASPKAQKPHFINIL